jgi:hypothetical protein
MMVTRTTEISVSTPVLAVVQRLTTDDRECAGPKKKRRSGRCDKLAVLSLTMLFFPWPIHLKNEIVLPSFLICHNPQLKPPCLNTIF